MAPPRPADKLEDRSVNALAHLYRGELGRLTAYRIRLDTTTNWAVGSTAISVTLAIGSQQIPHYVFGLPALLGVHFLWLESTRYRVYTISEARIRLLERGLYSDLLDGDALPEWRTRLLQTLAEPAPAVSYRQAVAERMRRVYLWLFITIYLSWLFKIGPSNLPEQARIGDVPGFLVVELATLLLVISIAFVLLRRSRS